MATVLSRRLGRNTYQLVPSSNIESEAAPDKTTDDTTDETTDIPPLGIPHLEKRFWFQRGPSYDPNVIATLVFHSLPECDMLTPQGKRI